MPDQKTTLINANIRPEWIAVKWGIAKLRAFAISSDGTVLAQTSSDDSSFRTALRHALRELNITPPCTIVACGLIDAQGTSNRSVPCAALELAPVRASDQVDGFDLWVIPNVQQNNPVDIMAGEETQISGFLSQNPDWEGVLCLPGSHTRWAQISAGEIVSFRTYLTGELIETLGENTSLTNSTEGEVWDDDAFNSALSKTLSRPESLAASLYSERAAQIVQGQSAEVSRAKLSGALIGAELAAAKPYWLGQNIAIIGDDHFSSLYRNALTQQGCTANCYDVDTALLAGLTAAYSLL